MASLLRYFINETLHHSLEDVTNLRTDLVKWMNGDVHNRDELFETLQSVESSLPAAAVYTGNLFRVYKIESDDVIEVLDGEMTLAYKGDVVSASPNLKDAERFASKYRMRYASIVSWHGKGYALTPLIQYLKLQTYVHPSALAENEVLTMLDSNHDVSNFSHFVVDGDAMTMTNFRDLGFESDVRDMP